MDEIIEVVADAFLNGIDLISDRKKKKDKKEDKLSGTKDDIRK